MDELSIDKKGALRSEWYGSFQDMGLMLWFKWTQLGYCDFHTLWHVHHCIPYTLADSFVKILQRTFVHHHRLTFSYCCIIFKATMSFHEYRIYLHSQMCVQYWSNIKISLRHNYHHGVFPDRYPSQRYYITVLFETGGSDPSLWSVFSYH